MCGIIGAAGTLNKAECDAFRSLLVLDSLRGEDSTGVAFVNNKSEVAVVKAVGDPFQLMETQSFNKYFREINRVMIGHNRYATTGKVIRKNAHPFDFKTLVGVHNGTLRNKGQLQDAYHFDTDSEALYHNFEIRGIKDTINDVEGAYSLVWYDKNNKSLNFLRNKERPMYIAQVSEGKNLFWASEEWMLRVALSREKLAIEQIVELPEDTHFSYSIPNIAEKFIKPFASIVKQKPPVPFTGGVTTLPHTNKVTTTHFIDKKKDSTGSSTVTIKALDPLLNKTLRLDAISFGKSGDGASFVTFISPDYDDKIFRSFVRNQDDCQKMLSQFQWEGTVTGIGILNNRSYYKVSHSTLIPVKKEKKVDHVKHPITEEEFNTRYFNCCWCNQNLEYNSNWKAISRDDCLCPDCVVNPEVVKYIT